MAVTLHVPATDAKSAHVADNNVQPFLRDDFDPADYLNNALPPLSTSIAKSTSNAAAGRPVALNELSTQLQTLLTQLNAQTTRLSNALTTLTDEILRSGGRLAYEVEVLRGETITLTDALDNGLRSDIEVFTGPAAVQAADSPAEGHEAEDPATAPDASTTAEPEYLTRLRTLTHARQNLTAVITLFGDAMQWPIAPSDLSTTSSLISVSAPDDDSRDREEKGKAYVAALHTEINELLTSMADPAAGLEAADARVEEMRVLAAVWKGTAEEKARSRIVDGLAKVVEERRKALGQGGNKSNASGAPARGVDYRYGNLDAGRGGEGGYGFLQNLRNLKNDMYLD